MTTNNPLTEHSRRRFMQGVAATGAIAAVGATAAQDGGTEFVLDGITAGWEGVEPSAIEGQVNPTLELEAGQTYQVTWENVDGLPHNFAILSADGEQLERSEVIEEQGATQTHEFEATAEMAEYYCEIHPDTMRGDVSISGGETQADGPPVEGVQVAGDFQTGATVGLQKVAEELPGVTTLETADRGDGPHHYLVTQTGQIYAHEPGAAMQPSAPGQGAGVPNESEQTAGAPNESEPTESNQTTEPNASADNVTTDGNVSAGNETDTPTQSGNGDSDTAGSVLTPENMDLVLDIQDRIVELGSEELGGYDERGLLGLAFHPDFAENGRFFVRYSAPSREGTPGDFDHTDVLAEFTMNEDGTADPESEQTILEVPQPQDNHNGGKLAFGPDGYLYTSIGDGGNVHDIGLGHVEDWYEDNEGGNAQDTQQNLLGGIHRIDVDADDGAGGAYSVPDDNPLVDQGDNRGEYYAWGFRNPWGMSFGEDGRLFVTDAGQHLIESVYVVEQGGNYSWNVKEGSFCFSPSSPIDPPADCPDETPEDVRGGEPLRDPVAEFAHMRGTEAFIDSSVVVHGNTYEGDAISELEGAFVFGNWSNEGVVAADGEVLTIRESDGGGDSSDGGDSSGEPSSPSNEQNSSYSLTSGGDNVSRPPTESPAEESTESPAHEANASEQEPDDEPSTGEEQGAGAADEDGDSQSASWELAALQFEGAEDQSLNRYVYAVERGADGELYVLTNTDYRPDPPTGEVYKIVPAGEGEDVPAPEDVQTVDTGQGQSNG